MATSLKTQVESLVGSIPAYFDNTSLGQALSDGCKDVIRRVSITNPEDIWLFTTSSAVNAAGLTVGSAKIYDVSRGNKPCQFLQAALRHRAAETDSIQYSTAEFPSYYLLNGKVFVLPEPGAGSDITITLYATYDSGNQTKITAASHGFNEGDQVIISQSNTIDNDTVYVGGHYVYDVIDTDNFIIHKNFVDVDETGYTVTEPTALCQHLTYPDLGASGATGATIDNFPESYHPTIVIYGAMVVIL